MCFGCGAVFLQDARDDVGGAQNAGMLGILVKTGKLNSDLQQHRYTNQEFARTVNIHTTRPDAIG